MTPHPHECYAAYWYWFSFLCSKRFCICVWLLGWSTDRKMDPQQMVLHGSYSEFALVATSECMISGKLEAISRSCSFTGFVTLLDKVSCCCKLANPCSCKGWTFLVDAICSSVHRGVDGFTLQLCWSEGFTEPNDRTLEHVVASYGVFSFKFNSAFEIRPL